MSSQAHKNIIATFPYISPLQQSCTCNFSLYVRDVINLYSLLDPLLHFKCIDLSLLLSTRRSQWEQKMAGGSSVFFPCNSLLCEFTASCFMLVRLTKLLGYDFSFFQTTFSMVGWWGGVLWLEVSINRLFGSFYDGCHVWLVYRALHVHGMPPQRLPHISTQTMKAWF